MGNGPCSTSSRKLRFDCERYHEFKQKEPFDNFKIYLIKAAFCVLGKRFSALLNGDGSQPHRILSSEHLALFFNGVKESRAP